MSKQKIVGATLMVGSLIGAIIWTVLFIGNLNTRQQDVASFKGGMSSYKTTEIRNITNFNVPVGQLKIDNPDGEDGRVSGTCTATVVEQDTIITANHCLVGVKDTATITFTPLLHHTDKGVMKPYGECRVIHKDVNEVKVADDSLYLKIQNCTDEHGQQVGANIGTRTGTVNEMTFDTKTWYSDKAKNLGVTTYGYAKYDGKGDVSDGTHLYELVTSPGGNIFKVETNVGKNVLTVKDSLEVGASGGPWLVKYNDVNKLVSVTSRKENMETVGSPFAMSGGVLKGEKMPKFKYND